MMSKHSRKYLQDEVLKEQHSLTLSTSQLALEPKSTWRAAKFISLTNFANGIELSSSTVLEYSERFYHAKNL